jgi:tRNA pseudouridine65 synthase
MAIEVPDDPYQLPVLARGEDWIVVAKPPRLLVHRASRARNAEHFALQLVRDQVGRFVYPVHRLDRAASGCLLFALDPRAAAALQVALNAEDAEKTYLAFVRGFWHREPDHVVVDNPMKDDNDLLKDAVTEITCVATCPEPRCSLLLARPRTGRFHQVRRHARDLSHPVLGDHAHGDTRVNRWWRETRGLHRLGLHCLSLDLPLADGTRLRATCPLYEDHERVLHGLPLWSPAAARLAALALPPLPVPDYLAPHDTH